MFVDWASSSNAFKAEIYFVGAREFPNCRFGGRLDEVQDPQTGLIVTLRAFGEYALRVVDPTKLILNLVGTVDVTNNEAITGWVAQQLLKVTRTTVTTQLMSGAWPILGLSMHSPEIEAAVAAGRQPAAGDYGMAIARFGNLDVNLDDDDNARLKKLAGDTAYSRLAGGFLQAAQAEALQGAGEGMAQGGGAVRPMFMGAGPGHGQPDDAAARPQAAPPPPPAPGSPAAARATRQRAAAGRRAARSTPPRLRAPPARRRWQCGNCQSQVRVGREVLRLVRHARCRSTAPTATPTWPPPRSSAPSAARRSPRRRPSRQRPARTPGSERGPAATPAALDGRPVLISRIDAAAVAAYGVSTERLSGWTGSNASGARPRTSRAGPAARPAARRSTRGTSSPTRAGPRRRGCGT